MEFQRSIYIGVTLILALFLWNAWQVEFGPKTVATHSRAAQHIVSSAQNRQQAKQEEQMLNAAIPVQGEKAGSSLQTSLKKVGTVKTYNSKINTQHILSVKTDVLNVKIDLQGGNIIHSSFPKYPLTLKDKNKPFVLLSHHGEYYYIAKSGLVSQHGPDNANGVQALYRTSQASYQLQPGQKQLQVVLTWNSPTGVIIHKMFTFQRNRYVVNVDYQIINNTNKTWTGNTYSAIERSKPSKGSSLMHFHSYTGAAISSPDEHYDKVSFKDMRESNLSQQVKGGWIAMLQHYFVSAWIPPAHQTFHYYSRALGHNVYMIGMVGPEITVAPKHTVSTQMRFYMGPAITKRLAAVAPNLDLTLDFGILWIFSMFIFKAMAFIYGFIGNWGWAIVIVTILIKLILYPLSAMSYKSMAKMRQLQPKLTALKERLGDDKQKFTKATMELYKREKVNPLSGCLPMLVQIPIFLGLYWVLLDSVELRQAPFILWIHDLSIKDPYYILPLLMGVSMFLQQKMSPPPPDPTQAKVMMFMPVIFTVLFVNFPAGLVLYWLVNNVVSVLQQWWITRQVLQGGHGGKRKK